MPCVYPSSASHVSSSVSSAEDVVPTLRAYQNAYESSGADLTKDELALAQRWAKAYDAARTAGFRDLGDNDEAFFEVRPV